MPETLHAEIEALHRSITLIARREAGRESESLRASVPATEDCRGVPDSKVEEAAAKGLGRLLSRELPVELRQRLEKIQKKLTARKPDKPRRDLGREILQLVDPLGQAGWADALLARSLAALPGVGPKRADGFARRGFERISDLLFWLPSRYEDRRRVVGVNDLEVGRSATFLAEVKVVDWVATRRGGRFGKIFQAVVGDDEAVVMLKWFRGGEALANQIVKGRWLLVSGEVRRYRFSKELIHPEIEIIPVAKGAAAGEDTEASEPGDAGIEVRDESARRSDLGRVVPIYSAPEGMNARTLRRLIGQSVDAYAAPINRG